LAWRRNGPRRSYASYRLAQTRDVLQTAEEDGHSAYILERDYKGLVTAAAAAEYFQLTPAACGIADWAGRVKDFLASHPSFAALPGADEEGPRRAA
jgi:hypothetical protein